MNSHPLTVQALVSGGIDAAANLVTLEGANIEARRANTLRYISLNGQNSQYVIEQFVVRTASPAKSLKDFRNGFKLLSAPGPANIGAARAVLKKIGLVEGTDFTIQEQQIQELLGTVESVKTEIGSIRDDEQEYLDNMPESMAYGDKGEKAGEAIQALDNVIDVLDTFHTSDMDSDLNTAAE